MKKYAAIGHWKGNDNMTSIAAAQNTKADFVTDLRANGFVPYVVITEGMMKKLGTADDGLTLYDMVKKMTTNYRVVNDVVDYLDQCFDILADKVAAAN